MARPSIHGAGPAVAVSVNGRGAGWCDGHFSGDKELIAVAREAAENGQTVELFNCTIVCDAATPLGAIGALASWKPGRTIVAECPPDVAKFFEENKAYV